MLAGVSFFGTFLPASLVRDSMAATRAGDRFSRFPAVHKFGIIIAMAGTFLIPAPERTRHVVGFAQVSRSEQVGFTNDESVNRRH